LEDETGMLNIVCSVGLFLRTKRTVSMSPALLIRGILERGDGGVVSVVADRLESLDLRVVQSSRNFR
jgi:error-prone DNA polymerase